MKPILVLQMQRMGDLVLSFPLLAWLAQAHPGRPLWVVAEPTFFQGLMPLAPPAVFFPWDAAPRLARERFHMVVNLSHRPEAAVLAGRARAETVLGPLRPDGRNAYIRGDWQLYRASLTLANRHNRFHWADLNALDGVGRAPLAHNLWPSPRVADPAAPVGLFVGASAPDKRPEPEFWAGLARELAARGLKPLFFGGPDERQLGARASRLASMRAADLTGKLDVPGLAAALGRLALLITPDTGPMHLAAWLSTPVLNLSMGPVNPHETGPYQPGHLVLRGARSCLDCWRCPQTSEQAPPCREAFAPQRVAALAARMLRNSSGGQAGLEKTLATRLPGLRLFASGRRRGLYDLLPAPGAPPTAKDRLKDLWQAVFANHLGLWGQGPARQAVAALAEDHPALAAKLPRALSRLRTDLARTKPGHQPPAQPLVRGLASYLMLSLDNGDHGPEVKAQAARLLDWLDALTSGLREGRGA